MKLRLWKRIVIMAFAVFALAGVALLALEAFDCGASRAIREFVTAKDTGTFLPANLVIFLGVLAILTAWCAYVFAIALNAGRVRGARLITLADAKGDAVLLSQDTLDQLVLKAIGEPEGVSNVKVVTGYADGQLDVMIDIVVTSNLNIPAATREMQENVRRQIADISGIQVSGVSVTISEIRLPEGGVPAFAPIAPALQAEPEAPEDAEAPEAQAEPEPASEEPASEEPASEEPAMEEPAMAEPEEEAPEAAMPEEERPEACEAETEAPAAEKTDEAEAPMETPEEDKAETGASVAEDDPFASAPAPEPENDLPPAKPLWQGKSTMDEEIEFGENEDEEKKDQ